MMRRALVLLLFLIAASGCAVLFPPPPPGETPSDPFSPGMSYFSRPQYNRVTP